MFLQVSLNLKTFVKYVIDFTRLWVELHLKKGWLQCWDKRPEVSVPSVGLLYIKKCKIAYKRLQLRGMEKRRGKNRKKGGWII